MSYKEKLEDSSSKSPIRSIEVNMKDPGHTSIRISHETRDVLQSMGSFGDSYETIIQRLIAESKK